LFSKIAIWLVIAMVLFTVFKQFDTRGGAGIAYLGYSEFLEEVRGKRIKSATIAEGQGGTEIVATTTDDRKIRTTATYLDRGLVGDLIAGRQDGIFGFIAHIVADIEGGPRGDPIRSPQLSRSLGNLMLMCARHHKLIDVEVVAEHPEPVLLAMKTEHETRIATVTGIDEDRASHVVRFAASIGDNEALVSTQAIFAAMPPDHHPASGQTLDLEMVGCAFRDNEPAYWAFHRENLRRQFDAKVRGRV